MSTRRTFVLVYLACLGLLGTTIGVAQLRLGALNSALNLTISAVKAFLVARFFMHVLASSGLVRLVSAGALFWLSILFGLSLADYLTRASW
jgi:cytochrome c oxidase subunit 4